jgi:hypothetical protein
MCELGVMHQDACLPLHYASGRLLDDKIRGRAQMAMKPPRTGNVIMTKSNHASGCNAALGAGNALPI